jgi:hypothetical protein
MQMLSALFSLQSVGDFLLTTNLFTKLDQGPTLSAFEVDYDS